MLSCNLVGGLGNKMFQIATTYSLALENEDSCHFEITNASNAHQPVTSYLNNIFRNVEFGIIGSKKHYQEPYFHYSKIPYTTDLKLLGYFQSEKYFINNKSKILDLFSIDVDSLNYINDKYGKILKNGNTCSIHVRRGDYLNLPNHHPIPSIDYYVESMKFFDKNTTFLVFSNDMEWCKNNFKGNLIFIENEKDYIDLWLMSLCDNNIITNSTFSWWGSWLNVNEDKKVIVPKVWFGSSISHNTEDLIPKEWLII